MAFRHCADLLGDFAWGSMAIFGRVHLVVWSASLLAVDSGSCLEARCNCLWASSSPCLVVVWGCLWFPGSKGGHPTRQGQFREVQSRYAVFPPAGLPNPKRLRGRGKK